MMYTMMVMEKVKEMMSCDIVVVGSGVSGMCAAVQAVNLGKKVIVIESCRHIGGNWNVTYGAMAVNSPQSRKLGIKVDGQALVNQELRLFNYQVDAKLWRDMVNMSGENIQWLMEQGVEINPQLEPYTAGEVNAPVFHTWVAGSAPAKKMQATYEKAGGVVLNETKGKSLMMKDGQIAGIIAEKKDGQVIQIECKAVISAGGGYSSNVKMVSSIIGIEDYANRGIGDNDGSTIHMCINSGAKSLLGHENVLADLIPRQMTKVKDWLNYIHSKPGSYPFHVNVNQDGERYVDESCTLKLYAFSPAASFSQERTFRIYDQEKLKKLEEISQLGMYDVFKTAADKGEAGIFRADTFEELALKLGLDPESFAETMRTYNNYCETGKDLEFDKVSEFLQGFTKPPFYGWENGYQIPATFEGVDYNAKMQVLTEQRQPIPGLYVAGTDGAKLWRDYYSLTIPGSCNANNIYSGRVSALSAVQYVG